MTNDEKTPQQEDVIPVIARKQTADWVRELSRQPHLAHNSISTYAIRLTEEKIGIALRTYSFDAERDFIKRLEWQRADYEKKIAELQEKLKKVKKK